MKVLVIGSGIAGLTAAIKAFETGCDVTIITKAKDPSESASWKAQGGIVYRGDADSAELLEKDILAAADGLAWPPAVEQISKEGPSLVKSFLLDQIKVPFHTKEDGSFAFTSEGAHSTKRILYSADSTGKIIVDHLLKYLNEKTSLKILTSLTAIDLITTPHHSSEPLDVYNSVACLGAFVYNENTHGVEKIFADKVILATGGIGRVYKYTTNPLISTGDGIAMAYRSGCSIANMEFTQFHPTSLAIKPALNFLLTEALRGEGAILLNQKGEDFTIKYDKRGSLASRDVVARAITLELESSGDEFVLLSLKNINAEKIKSRFPTIYQTCLDHKIDITKEAIPVLPAFHFSCGGVLTDTNGQTSLSNLYAIGETACTGIHGANRLASVSLLETVFLGIKASQHIAASSSCLDLKMIEKIKDWDEKGVVENADPALIRQDWATLKSTMWNYAGIVRTSRRLTRALDSLYSLQQEVDKFYKNVKVNREIIELRNAIQTGILIVRSALKNKVSRGCHFRND